MARAEGSDPDDPDGLMNDQEMPTADGQMASNTSEEVIPPTADRRTDPKWGADSGSGGPGVSGHGDAEQTSDTEPSDTEPTDTEPPDTEPSDTERSDSGATGDIE